MSIICISFIYWVLYKCGRRFLISHHDGRFLDRKDGIMEHNKTEGESVEIPQIMTLQEVADYLGFHYLTIYRLIQERKIPAAKIGGSWRFRKDILDDWIKTDMNQRYRNNRNKRVA